MPLQQKHLLIRSRAQILELLSSSRQEKDTDHPFNHLSRCINNHFNYQIEALRIGLESNCTVELPVDHSEE